MTWQRGLVVAIRSLLAMLAALVVIYVVNSVGSWLAGAAGFASGGDLRLGWDLGWVVLSGILATCALVMLAPCAPRAHALAFFVLALVIDVVAVRQMWDDWPHWFSIGALIALPLQVWLGLQLALRSRWPKRAAKVP